jgi:iron complex outermembrane receptor protein
MADWGKVGAGAVLGAALVAAEFGGALAAEPFVDTRVMTRHAGQILPDVLSYDNALAGKTTFPYRRQAVPAFEPNFADTANAPKPVALMAGVSEGSTSTLATRLRAAGDDWGVGAAARSEQAHSYRDGAGTRLNYGFERDVEWLGARWGKAEETQAEVSAVRDVLEDGKLLNYGLDVQLLEQGGTRAAVESRNLPGWFNHAGAVAAWGFAHVDVNNYSLRRPGASTRLRGLGDHEGFRAGGWAAHDEASSRTLFGTEAARQHHTAKRYDQLYGPDAISGYWLPGVDVVRGSAWAEHTRRWSDTSVQAGLRYDAVSMSADDVHKRPATRVAAYNFSAQQLYDRYYGRGADNDSLDHNVSARLRGEQRLAPQSLAYVDFAHMVRSPDHTERYNGNGGPASLVEVGNPALDPEQHDKLTLGGETSGGGFRGYGRTSPAGAWRMEGNAWHDRVTDFVAIDMARGQPGVLVASGGQVYRNVDAAISGVSGDLQAVLADHLGVRLNVAGQRGRNLTDHRPLHQMAPFEANLFVDTFGGDDDFGWNMGSRLRAVAAKRAVDSNAATGSGMDTAGPAGAFATLDLYAGVDFGHSVAVTAGIDNVFDKLYREHIKATPNNSTGVMPNAPGRTWVLRALVTF